MIDQLQIHPSVPIGLFPGIAPSAHSAAREARRIVYLTLAAVSDAKHHRARRPDVKASVRRVAACLVELRDLRDLLGLAGADTAEIDVSIARVEDARQALEDL